jgi:glycosyltransferase involved in cell wall biosynthesis
MTHRQTNLRVAFITNLAPHYRRPLFEELNRRLEVDFYFFSAGQERYLSSEMKHQQGAYRTVPLRRLRVGHQTITPGLIRHLHQDRYDVVVKCLNGKLMVPFVQAITRARGLPLVVWTGMWYHPRRPFHRLTRPLTYQVYRNADAIVTYGEHVRDYIADIPGVHPEKIFVAGQAVDGSSFATSPNQPPRSRSADVVYIGQLEERKGLDYLLDAFSSLSNPDARLLLIGTGSRDEHVKARSSSDPRIRLVGHVPQEELPEVLRAARCPVLPSVTGEHGREPWGLVVNEAMHSSLPVIASSAVGAAAGRLVVDGRNGFIVPERDSTHLARAIGRLLDDPALACSMGDTASQDVRRFNFESMADAFVEACVSAHTQSRESSRVRV